MMIFKLILFLALLLNVNADLTLTVSSSTLSTVKCATKFAITSAKTAIKATTATTTVSPEIVLIRSVSTPVKTVTGPPSTVTSTVPVTTTVITTNAAVTGIFSTTTTIVTVTTVVNLVTDFTTETVTSSVTSTTTIVVPTPQGFIPAYDSSGDQNFPGQNPKKRGFLHSPNLSWDKKGSYSPYKYPSAIKCAKSIRVRYIKKIIVLKSTVTKTAPGSTRTVVITQIRTSISTVVPPNVSSTTIFSTTSTSKTTVQAITISTRTSTQTETVVTTTTTYAACATNNVLGPRVNNGNYLGSFDIVDLRDEYNQKEAANAYECCVACQTGNSCQFAVFFSNETCLNLENPSYCNGTPFTAALYAESTTPSDFTGVYSNGPCGQVERIG